MQKKTALVSAVSSLPPARLSGRRECLVPETGYHASNPRRFAAGGEGGAWGSLLNSNTCSTQTSCEGRSD